MNKESKEALSKLFRELFLLGIGFMLGFTIATMHYINVRMDELKKDMQQTSERAKTMEKALELNPYSHPIPPLGE